MKKQIEIQVEQTVIRGERYLKITGLKCKAYDELPRRYLNEYPYCHMSEETVVIQTSNTSHADREYIKINNVYTPKAFDHLIQLFKQCAARLREINHQIEKETEGWDKLITHII